MRALKPVAATRDTCFQAIHRSAAARCRSASLCIVGGFVAKAHTISKHGHNASATVYPTLRSRDQHTRRSLHWTHEDDLPACFSVWKAISMDKGTQCLPPMNAIVIQQWVMMDTHTHFSSRKAIARRASKVRSP